MSKAAFEAALAANGFTFVAGFQGSSGNDTDLIGGKTGTASGSPTYSAAGPVPGVVGIGFDLDGTDFFTYADHADLDLGDGPFTILFWFRRVNDSGTQVAIFGKGGTAYVVNINSTDQIVIGKSGTANMVRETSTTPADSTWHMHTCARTSQGAGNTLWYRDRDAEAHTDVSPANTLENNTSALIIGKESAGPGGELAYVAILKGTAISSATREAIYDAMFAFSGTDSGSGSDASIAGTGGTDHVLSDSGSGTDVAALGGQFRTVTLVVGNPAAPTTTDAKLKTELEALGHVVTYVDDSSAEDNTRDMVVIAESCASASIGTKYRNINKPLLVCEPFAWDAMDFVTNEVAAGISGTAVDITGAGHAAAGGLSGDGVTIYSAARDRGYAPNATAGFGAGVSHIAEIAGTTGDRFHFVYDAGATMANGHTAEARRAGMGWSDNSGDAWHANAVTLFAATVTWLLGLATDKVGTDSGAGADVALAALVLVAAPDSGTATETAFAATVIGPVADSGSGADASTKVDLGNSPVVTDAGVGIESMSEVDYGTIETGSGAEGPTVVRDIVVFELVTPVDTAIKTDSGQDHDVNDAGAGFDFAILGLPLAPGGTAGIPNPRLVIEYFSSNPTTYGPATRLGVVHDASNVGWSWYSRYPANAFFTLRQNSIHNALLDPLKTHLRIWYVNDATGYSALVFTGRLSDPDSTGEDVVWTAWNYLAELSLSRTGYRTLYPAKTLAGGVAQPEWELAKAQPNSLMGHVLTGTFQNPFALDGTTVIKTDNRFGVIDVPRLLLMFDLTEIGRANTANNVTFEITRLPPHTFNFWRNRGSALIRQRLAFPGAIADYRFVPGYSTIRNDLATIGTSAAGGAVEIIKTEEASAVEFGRRQDVFTIKTLSGLAGAPTESDAQQAITARAVKEATQLSRNIAIDLRSGQFEPFDGWDIEDTVPVKLARGRDNIDTVYRIVGVRGTLDERGYHPQILVQLPTAA